MAHSEKLKIYHAQLFGEFSRKNALLDTKTLHGYKMDK